MYKLHLSTALIVVAAVGLMAWIYGLLDVSSHTLPPLYLTGAAPTNPTVEGTLWLSTYLRQKGVQVLYVYNWSSAQQVLLGYRAEKLIIFSIAPEKPYTPSDIAIIQRLIRAYQKVVIIAADESTTINSLLVGLGSPVVISPTPLYNTVVEKDEETAYVLPAILRINNKTFHLLVNLAAPIVIVNMTAANTTWKTIVLGIAEKDAKGIAIAAETRKKIGTTELVIYVIGDSFPFTNLAYFVDRKMGKNIYTSFAKDLLSYFIGREANNTVIVFDVSKYYTLPELLSQPSLVNRYTISLDREAALVASLAHPSTWIPLIRYYSGEQYVQRIVENPLLAISAYIVFFITLYAVYTKTVLSISFSTALRELRLRTEKPQYDRLRQLVLENLERMKKKYTKTEERVDIKLL